MFYFCALFSFLIFQQMQCMDNALKSLFGAPPSSRGKVQSVKSHSDDYDGMTEMQTIGFSEASVAEFMKAINDGDMKAVSRYGENSKRYFRATSNGKTPLQVAADAYIGEMKTGGDYRKIFTYLVRGTNLSDNSSIKLYISGLVSGDKRKEERAKKFISILDGDNAHMPRFSPSRYPAARLSPSSSVSPSPLSAQNSYVEYSDPSVTMNGSASPSSGDATQNRVDDVSIADVDNSAADRRDLTASSTRSAVAGNDVHSGGNVAAEGDQDAQDNTPLAGGSSSADKSLNDANAKELVADGMHSQGTAEGSVPVGSQKTGVSNLGVDTASGHTDTGSANDGFVDDSSNGSSKADESFFGFKKVGMGICAAVGSFLIWYFFKRKGNNIRREEARG